jgi:Na+-translocating ferredoxin:NAD+ oxidoreductase RNF subunit RnfB
MSARVKQSRRDWLRCFVPLKSDAPESESADVPKKAIIQGRHCLAYQRSFCSTCSERCPVEGAIKVERGVPQIVADACTGCGICFDVCPAPTNAILMMPVKGKARHV